MSIVVMVDSGACFPKNILKRKDVVVVPLVIGVEEHSFKDNKDLINKIDNCKSIPIIHKPSKEEVEKEIRKYIDNGHDVLYLTISSKLSNHYQDILEISKSLDSSSFAVIDTINLSTGETILLNLALDCIDKGYGLKQTCNYLNKMKYKIKSTYVVTDFNTLYVQDKCEDFKNKYPMYLDRYPITEVCDGEVKVTFNASSLDIAYQILENNIMDYIDSPSDIVISSIENKDFINKLKKKLMKTFDNLNIIVVENNSLLKLCLGEKGIACSIVSKTIL